MARPDALVPGSYYYMVHYVDEALHVPEVMTLQFMRVTAGDDGEQLWLFTPSDPGTESGEVMPLGVPESQLYSVLDFSGLLSALGALRGFHPSITLGNKLDAPEVLKRFRIIEQLEQFTADPRRHLHVSIRYTDDGVFLKKTPDGMELHAFAHPLLAQPDDAELVAVLVRRGIQAKTDYLADEGRTRILEYRLPSDIPAIADICAEIFVMPYRITDADELLFKPRTDWLNPEDD
jgi:hypothetical protein